MTKKDLDGKIALVVGVGDDQGYGWPIAKELAERGATILLACWVPIHKIFTTSWANGKFDESRKLSDGSLFEVEKVYPIDAVYDKPEQVPEEIKNNKRYQAHQGYTVSEVAKQIENDYDKLDMVVHCLANGPEVKNPLLETSREGYLAAISSSAYSFVSFVQHFGPLMNYGGSFLTLSYLAAERVIPGYGGGMSSAKAALESDTRMLAYEAGQKWGVRVNAISAGALASRAAKAIGFIGKMIEYSKKNAPLPKDLESQEIGKAAGFLLTKDASAVTGAVLHVDNGIHAMGCSLDSPAFTNDEPEVQEGVADN